MGKSYGVRCGDLKSKVKVDKAEDLKSAITREVKKGYYSNMQLGFFILIKQYGNSYGKFEYYCATDELFDPK